jgi:hypothetical protein
MDALEIVGDRDFGNGRELEGPGMGDGCTRSESNLREKVVFGGLDCPDKKDIPSPLVSALVCFRNDSEFASLSSPTSV